MDGAPGTVDDPPMSANLADPSTARTLGRGPSHALLAGEIGAEVALGLSKALDQLDALLLGAPAGELGLRVLREAIGRARHVAMLGQQVSRLARGAVELSPETMDLPTLWRQLLRQRQGDLGLRGLEVRQRLRPATVCLDPSLLCALLDGLLDWTFEHCTGAVLHLSIELETWPVRARLHCHFGWQKPPEETDAAAALDTVAWRLVQQAAASLGVQCEREAQPSCVRLMLTFPEAAARRWPQLVDAVSMAQGAEPAPAAAPDLAGRTVLLLAPRAELLRAAEIALTPLGAELLGASGVDDALRQSHRALVDVLVADATTPGLDALCARLCAGSSGPALVRVGDEPAGVHLSTSARAEVARVGIDALAADLPRALLAVLR